MLDDDNSINDLQSNEVTNNKKVINSSENSNTPIQLTSNDNKYILNDNRKSNSIKNVPIYQLQIKDNDNTINDLQSNKDINNMYDNNVSNNSHTSIQSEGNHSNNIIKGNVYKNSTKCVPTHYSKKKNDDANINNKRSNDDNSNNNANNYPIESVTQSGPEIKKINKNILQKGYPHIKCKQKIMIIILMINNITKIIIIIIIIIILIIIIIIIIILIHRTVV